MRINSLAPSTLSRVVLGRALLSIFLCVFGTNILMSQQTQTSGNKADTIRDTKTIEEVVLVGYGTQKRTKVTTAVTTIQGEILENRSAPNIANMIQGAAPGLVVTRSSGRLSAQGLALRIRGEVSTTGGMNPLIIIDGAESDWENFAGLNPDDIENITVLKDGGAVAIYGAQAAGGVLLVETKKGKRGKPKLTFSSSVAIQKAINLPERMSLLEEMEFVNLARANRGSPPEYPQEFFDYVRNGVQYILDPVTNRWETFNTEQNFIDMTIRKSYEMIRNNVQMSGGGENVTYLVSIGNLQQQGALKVGEDYFTRWNARVNLSAKVNDYLSFNFRSSYNGQAVDNPVSGGRPFENGADSVLRQMWRARQRWPIFDPLGRYYAAGNSSYYGYASLQSGGFNRDRKEYFSNNIDANITNIVEGLKFMIKYGRDLDTRVNRSFARRVEFWNGPESRDITRNLVNRYSISDVKTVHENFQGIAEYEKTIAFDHTFKIMAGYQVRKYDFANLSGSTSNLYVNDEPSLNFTDDPENRSNGEGRNSSINQSIFGRFNYDYQSKYLFEVTVRSDESSRIRKEIRTKIFPSFSIGWNVAKETWFESFSKGVLNDLKPRFSWATVGSTPGIGYYDYIRTMSTNAGGLMFGKTRAISVQVNGLPAVDRTWEKVETQNLGLDFSLLDRKLRGSFEYFIKRNNSMAVPVSYPATLGIGAPPLNEARLKVWGWEIDLSYGDRIGEDFRYNVRAHLADNTNKLIYYQGNNNKFSTGVNRLIEGYELNSVWVYKTDGYFQNAAELAQAPSYANISDNSTLGVGDIRYVDINGDGVISTGDNTLNDTGDAVYYGNLNPRYQFGVNIDLNYKKFDLAVFIQGIGKRLGRPSNDILIPHPNGWSLPLTYHRDYWTPENPNAFFPRPLQGRSVNYENSDKWYFSHAYARLKNVQLGYTFRQEDLLKGTPIQRLRVYVSGEDLFTISAIPKQMKKVIDPELNNNVDTIYPFSMSFSFGLTVDF